MIVMTSCVSLAELEAAGIRLRPTEAVTVVAEMCRQLAHGEIPGIPSPAVIRVTREGGVVARGPMTREEASVSRAAHLLTDLLPGVNAPAEYRASGGLRLVLARALGTLDLPSYSGLDEFCAALARFAGPDPVATARGLFHRWEARHEMPEPAPITALVPSGPQAIARIDHRASRDWASSAVAIAVAALLALVTFAIVLGFNARRPIPNSQLPTLNSRGIAPVQEVRPVESSAPVAERAGESTPGTGPRARPVRQPRRAAARPHSFLHRELIRIDIR
jgi:hypothetical protein